MAGSYSAPNRLGPHNPHARRFQPFGARPQTSREGPVRSQHELCSLPRPRTLRRREGSCSSGVLRRVRLAQPAESCAIKNHEQELGVELFTRTKRKVARTTGMSAT